MGEAESVRQSETLVVSWLGEPACGDVRLVGGKAARLSLLSGHHPVPEAFCVTTAAHSAFSAVNAMPIDVSKEVVGAYERLSSSCGFDPDAPTERALPVAVRSSAADEDGSSASFAGQHETHLNVRGRDDLLAAVESVWRSVRSENALAYRRERGLEGQPAAIAVLVQRLIDCDTSGVVFSADPVSSDRDKVVISASWGLGESLVGGAINPDRWVLEKETLNVLERTVGDKELMTITQDGGTREVKTPTFLRRSSSLDDEQVLEVARLAKELEARFGGPVDVEFAYVAGRPVLLQCRPVTTLSAPDAVGEATR